MKIFYFPLSKYTCSVLLGLVCATLGFAQTGKTVSGTVKDNLLPLAGVMVYEAGTTNTTYTDENGNYHLTLEKDHSKLIFEDAYFQIKEEEVRNRSVINVSLVNENANINLEEAVVNAGYYTVKERDKTGSIARVTAKEIENQPVNNVLSALQGRMAGVSIVQNTGVAGGGFDVQIRGKNSLRKDGNEPLYIVDGVPFGSEAKSIYSITIIPAQSINPLSGIHPNDILSIEVLKDADATAIYGSRGANGVILVTTKKGRKGRLEATANFSYHMSKINSRLKLLNTSEYLYMREEAFKNDGVLQYPVDTYDVNGIWDKNRSTNWQNELIGRTAFSSNSDFSVAGGNENTSFSVGFGHYEASTIFRNDLRYKTNQLTNSFHHQSIDKKFNLTVSNLLNFQSNNVINEDVTKKSLILAPNAPALYDAEGNLNWENNTFVNPVAAYNSTYNNSSRRILSNLSLSYEVLKNLQLKVNGGINWQSFEEWSLKPNTSLNPSYVVGQSSAYSTASKNTNNRFSYVVEPQVNWIFNRDNHALDVLVGGTYQDDTNELFSITGTGFESNAFLNNLSAAKTKNITNQLDVGYKYTAVFGRVNYKFRNTYIINLTGRRDGSSRFGPQEKFANFGAVGAAWLFTNEEFLKESKWLSFGKLRGSYGTTGSDQIGDFQYLDSYTVASTIYNGVTGLTPSRLFNPNFSWERTNKLEIATELGFLNNRLNFNVAWYHNNSSNQLVGIPLPAITGFSSVLANLNATIINTGWEFELNASPIQKQVKWETSFNLSIPRNKLQRFPDLEGSTYRNSYVIGQPLSIVKVYQYEGIDPTTGYFTFKDFNEDGKISSPDDNKIIRKIGVELHGGWTNSFSYKNWNLSFLFQFVKQQNWNYNKLMSIPGSFNNQPKEVLNVWSIDNPNGVYMPYSAGGNSLKNQRQLYYQNSTAAISDASFIRLKNIHLNYTLPLKNAVVKQLNIYVQGQNLWTITNYFGLDPEFTTIGYLPPLKTISLGVQLKF